MDRDEYVYDNLSRAIAIMTAWKEDVNASDFPAQILLSYVEEGVSEVDLVAGLISLNGALLTQLEKYAQRMPDDVLREIAEKYRPKFKEG